MTTPVLPAVTVTTSTVRATSGPPSSTGAAFVAGQATSGPVGEARPVYGMADFVTQFGARLPASGLYDWLETFFSTGGQLAYVSREADGATSDETLTAALGAFDPLLGPGQVAAPNRTTAAVHALLLAHAEAANRTALIDLPNLSTAAALTTAADTASAIAGAPRALLMDTWFRVPGLTAGSERAVPGSAVLAGRLALSDAERDPGEFPAGDNRYGRLPYVLGRTGATRTDTERAALNGAGVIVTRPGLLGGPAVIYGARSLSRTQPWVQATAGRLRMALQADCQTATERVMQFGQVDGQGRQLSIWNAALRGICASYFAAGALFGETPDDAYGVDTGTSINPPTQLAQGIARAVVEAKFSPLAERSRIDLTILPLAG